MQANIPSPAYIIDLEKLEQNLKILQHVKEQAECHIVLALKAYSLWHTFPLIGQYLDGCCASGLHEAMLSHEHMQKHTLTYSPAYKEAEIEQLMDISSHLDFNSANQWEQFKQLALNHSRYQSGNLKYGLRINPEHSTGSTEKYDPCSPYSRLGMTREAINETDLTGISGLHFHALCEQYTDDLESTLEAIDHRFGHILKRKEITWLNMGGGHWITKPDYDTDKLVELIQQTKERYDLEAVWLEPGEAVAIHTGVLSSTVLDIVKNGENKIAIVDVSATAHMPDTLEMPYRPDIFNAAGELAGEAGEKTYNYHIGGTTCLAGDTLGAYSFDRELKTGDKLIFDDMAHYTMVKTTTFNGVPHPAIYTKRGEEYTLLRAFSYDDFKSRLG